jgi:hypothetical protein
VCRRLRPRHPRPAWSSLDPAVQREVGQPGELRRREVPGPLAEQREALRWIQAVTGPKKVTRRGTNDGFLDSIIDYGVGSQPDKAAQKLEDAGYSQDGDSWVDPDGESIDLRIVAPSSPENANVGTAVSGLLNDFGISNNFSLLEPGTYRDVVNFREGNHEFDMDLTDVHAARGISELVKEWTIAYLDAPHGWDVSQIGDCEEASTPPKTMKRDTFEENDEGQLITPKYGIPLTEDGLMGPPMPTEIGRDDLDGETTNPDIPSFSWWSSFRHPEDQLREWNTTCLWWANFHVPRIQFYTRAESLWMDEKNYKLTDSSALDSMGDAGKWWGHTEDKHPHNLGEMTSR